MTRTNASPNSIPSASPNQSKLRSHHVTASAIGGLLALQLVGCNADQQARPRMTAVSEPRDVQVSFPGDESDGSRGIADRSADLPQRQPTPSVSTDIAPRRVGTNELLTLLAADGVEMPHRLQRLQDRTAEANEIARQGRAGMSLTEGSAAPPTATQTPPPAPSPAAKPAEPSPAIQPVVPAAPTAGPSGSSAAAPPVVVATTPNAPTVVSASDVSETAHALADAITAVLQKNTPPDQAQRSVGKAVSAALAAIGDPTRAFDVHVYTDLEEDERAFVTRLHEASASVGRDLAGGKPIGEAVAKLAEAIKSVEPVRPLLVKRSEFATKVEGFGQLAPIANRRFLPGRQNQIILYTELDGFTSDRNEKNEWVTSLATKVQILAKHDGTEVWSRNWQAVTDVSTVRRDDFFVCEKVTLSEFLTIGTYVMKVSVRDEKSQAIAEKSVEFSMVADPALAAR